MNFYSNGKLLITSEYLVLDGAKALALPTKQGQDLIVDTNNSGFLSWKSLDFDGTTWFSCVFDIGTLKIINTNHIETAKTLQKILLYCKTVNISFLNLSKGADVITNLTFNKNWGLGTSSTLINNIANWANMNAFDLQFKIFGGSAYDIACAQNNQAILYQLDSKIPTVTKIDFNPPFKEQLFFVYLNKKQNSRDAIKKYKSFKGNKNLLIKEISELTEALSTNKSFSDFEKLLLEHENIISKIIGVQPVQQILFNDYFGQIKSLGAWGGDFILATGNDKSVSYFNKKGFDIVLPYSKIIL